mgnify:CR=1 FL=1
MGYFAGAKMLAKGLKFRNIIALALMAMLLLPSVGKAYPSGIAGPYDVNGDGSIDAENDLLDVAKEGCTCHNAVFTNLGEKVSGPANSDLESFSVSRDENIITVST